MFEHTSWGSVASLVYGRSLKDRPLTDGGPSQVYGTNGPIGYTNDALSDGPGVIVGRKGEYRGIHYSPGPFWVIDTAYYLQPSEGVDMLWAYYALKNSDVNGLRSGSAIPSTTKADFYAMGVLVPEYKKQVEMATVLRALDDKIAANAELARTITDHLQACVDRTASSARALDEVAAFRNRERRPLSSRERDLFPGKVPYFGAAGQIGTVGGSLFNDPLVLIGEDGSVVKSDKTSYSQYVWGPSWVNNHAHVLTGSGVSTELLYFLLRRAPVDTLTTGAAQPKLSMGNLRRLHVQAPAIDALPALESTVDLEMALLRSITEESRKLVDIRDTLLPHLMSGRLKVRDAEKTVSDAV